MNENVNPQYSAPQAAAIPPPPATVPPPTTVIVERKSPGLAGFLSSSRASATCTSGSTSAHSPSAARSCSESR